MIDNNCDESKSSPTNENSFQSSNNSETNQNKLSQESILNKQIKLKLLIPSNAAGAIIGKNGETISQIQAQTEARIKLSKPNELYPGTNDRVCLITGTKKAILELYDFISKKIQERPDTKSDDRGTYPRHMQVKILVSSSTAGMIIGKGGNIIKEIKSSTSAFIQLSQKPQYSEIPERCVILAGDPEQTRPVVNIILDKIIEDPNSFSFPEIVYLDPFNAPSPFPTGSPYAIPNTASSGHLGCIVHNNNQYAALSAINSTSGTSNSHSGGNPSSYNPVLNQNRFFPGMANDTNGLRIPSNGSQRYQNPSPFNFKYPNRSALQSQGFPEYVVEEIISALNVLSIHGIKLRNLNFVHPNRNLINRINVPCTNASPSAHQPNYMISTNKSNNQSSSLALSSGYPHRNIDTM